MTWRVLSRLIEGRKACIAKRNKMKASISRAEFSKNLENPNHISIASFLMWTSCKASRIHNSMIEAKDLGISQKRRSRVSSAMKRNLTASSKRRTSIT